MKYVRQRQDGSVKYGSWEHKNNPQVVSGTIVPMDPHMHGVHPPSSYVVCSMLLGARRIMLVEPNGSAQWAEGA